MSEQKNYVVLARKYRPQSFAQVVGQDALVRTLKNAIEGGRIAQAYMLTGVRGTGKTTTARLIARALNYTGADGKAGPTTGATDDCEICRAIAEGRCPDVMEMDAASRTGVDDIREIIDGVRYAPAVARYKIYIIDEVHMLSKNAFNALLKTLEEPPPHVVFIFATTEIRKVPVTVLSRCQRFDLRRIDAGILGRYYAEICTKENVQAEEEALQMIASAADGSARDGMSLLDQAIARGAGAVTAQLVRDMMGLADRGRVLDMLEHALQGRCGESLDVMADLHAAGADPLVMLQDMLDLVHVLTRMKAVPALRDAAGFAARETLERLKKLSEELSMPTLGRAWQLLLKGLSEVQEARNTRAAAEMILIRLVYAADLPDPADLLKKLKNGEAVSASSSRAPAGGPPSGGGVRVSETVSVAAMSSGSAAGAALSVPQSLPEQAAAASLCYDIRTLEDIEKALSSGGFVRLAGEVYSYVHLVKIEPGRLEIRVQDGARREVAGEIGKALQQLTGERWIVTVSAAAGQPTLAEKKQQAQKALAEEAATHPVVAKVLALFPGATLTAKEK